MGAQPVKIFQEQSLSLKNIQTIGVQTKKFYVSVGSNVVEQAFGLHNHYDIQTETHHYGGQTYWYQSPTNHYGVERPRTTLWTSRDYGNYFWDQTNYKGAVISNYKQYKQTYFSINSGILKNMDNNTQVRIGGGINVSNTKGTHEYQKITTDRIVNYYYDDVLKMSHVVVMNNNVSIHKQTYSMDKIKVTPTINVTLVFKDMWSVGYNSNEGMTVGLIYRSR